MNLEGYYAGIARFKRERSDSECWDPYLCVNSSGELSLRFSRSRSEPNKAYELCIRHDGQGTPTATLLTDSLLWSDGVMGRAGLSTLTPGCWPRIGSDGNEITVKEFHAIMQGVVASRGPHDNVNDMIKKTLIAILDSERPLYRFPGMITGTLTELYYQGWATKDVVDKLCDGLCQFAQKTATKERIPMRRLCSEFGYGAMWPDDSTKLKCPYFGTCSAMKLGRMRLSRIFESLGDVQCISQAKPDERDQTAVNVLASSPTDVEEQHPRSVRDRLRGRNSNPGGRGLFRYDASRRGRAQIGETWRISFASTTPCTADLGRALAMSRRKILILFNTLPFAVRPRCYDGSSLIACDLWSTYLKVGMLVLAALKSPLTMMGLRSLLLLGLYLTSFTSVYAHHVRHAQLNSVNSYISHESPIAQAGLLANIGPDGAKSSGAMAGIVIASPSTSNPDYLYTWTRDASLVFKVLIDQFTSGQDKSQRALIDDFVSAQAFLQQIPNLSGGVSSGGLGEPKFYINETAFNGEWGRPQNDGPALRATAIINYANWLIDHGNTSWVTNTLWPVIKLDLDFVALHWNLTTYDLWEEIYSSSFFTTAVQHRALREGSSLAAKIGQKRVHSAATISNTAPGRSGKDANTVLASIHTFDPAAGCDAATFQPCSDKALANLKAYVDSFRPVYSLNRGKASNAAVATGRYPEDVYYNGNPWYLTTFAVAEQLYDALIVWEAQHELQVTETSLEFFRQFDPFVEVGTYASWTLTYQTMTSAIKTFADGFVLENAKYTPSNGELSEQYDKSTGQQTSAIDLTWSYASALTVFAARSGFTSPSWGAKGLTVPATCEAYGTATKTVPVTFNVNATTVWGENIYITGGVPALQNWSPDDALLLSAADYPIWSITVSLPAGTVIQYKYLRKYNGSVTWESDPNGQIATPGSGNFTETDTWRAIPSIGSASLELALEKTAAGSGDGRGQQMAVSPWLIGPPVLVYPARPASFGTELSDPLLGYVIPLSSFTAPCSGNNTSHFPFIPDPVQGCPDLCVSGPHQPERTEAWIALVQRGGCPFVEKARQAQTLGAKAVVVGGDKENPDALLNMYSEKDSSDVHIAATFIKYWDYAELLALIASSNTTHQGLKTVSLLLSTEYSAWEWYSPIITFIIILLLPSILTFITLLIHRIRAARAAQRERAPEEFVHNLPWRVWTGTGWEKHAAAYPPEDPSEDPSSAPDLERGIPLPSSSRDGDEDQPPWVDEQAECAICLELFVKGDRVRVLPCGHLFHLTEIDEWLISKKKVVRRRSLTDTGPPSIAKREQSTTPCSASGGADGTYPALVSLSSIVTITTYDEHDRIYPATLTITFIIICCYSLFASDPRFDFLSCIGMYYKLLKESHDVNNTSISISLRDAADEFSVQLLSGHVSHFTSVPQEGVAVSQILASSERSAAGTGVQLFRRNFVIGKPQKLSVPIAT
ncbi:hypothetical protein NM688_g3339 [Phlebia brevispora]|uniref:Uncharacterized protein n=1 Tax=Phlebia brevispora TaxID=194682 RepID=A0ACC1T665_9APHY|nr:hypothetical protein NM688_g3339 [Phlebia brevispora]